MKIRKADHQDINKILEIYNHSIIHTTSVYWNNAFTKQMMLGWFKKKQELKLPILVSLNNETISGYATYGPFRDAPGYIHSVEHSVHIHPDFRRKGIAKLLMLELIKIAKSNGIHTLIGGIDADNNGSIEFHKQLGFKEVANIKQVGYKFNKWLDLKLLQLILED